MSETATKSKLDEKDEYGPSMPVIAQGGLEYKFDLAEPDWERSEKTLSDLGDVWQQVREWGRKRNPKRDLLRELMNEWPETDAYVAIRAVHGKRFAHQAIQMSTEDDAVYEALGRVFGPEDGSMSDLEWGSSLSDPYDNTTEALLKVDLPHPNDGVRVRDPPLGEFWGKWFYQLAEASGRNEQTDVLEAIFRRVEDPWIVTQAVFRNFTLYTGSKMVIKAVANEYDVDNPYRKWRVHGDIANFFLEANRGITTADLQPHDMHNTMKANSTDASSVQNLNHDEWVAQTKYDGARLFVHSDSGDDVRAYSSGMRDVTAALPELNEIDWPEPPFIFDAEATPYNEDGEPIPFENIMTRLTREGTDIDPDDFETDVVFKFFDCMHWHGRDITNRKYSNRFQIVQDVFEPQHVARTGEDLENTFQSAVENGHEGLVIKRKDGTYMPGGRHSQWRKWKPEPETIEARVMGVISGGGRLSDRMGSLQLALRGPDDETIGVGEVGTGFSDEERLEWWHDYEAGDAIGSVIEIAYEDLQYAGGNWGLRFPRYKRRRPDGEVDSVERAARLIGRDDDIEDWLG